MTCAGILGMCVARCLFSDLYTTRYSALADMVVAITIVNLFTILTRLQWQFAVSVSLLSFGVISIRYTFTHQYIMYNHE